MAHRPNPSANQKEEAHEARRKVDHTYGSRCSRGSPVARPLGCRRHSYNDYDRCTVDSIQVNDDHLPISSDSKAGRHDVRAMDRPRGNVSDQDRSPDATRSAQEARIQAFPCRTCSQAVRRPRTSSSPCNRHQVGRQAQGRRSSRDRFAVTYLEHHAQPKYQSRENRT